MACGVRPSGGVMADTAIPTTTDETPPIFCFMDAMSKFSFAEPTRIG